ncbi:hypothetical protein Dred_3049 [Desulforamulus reducens MI-1]|uniref:Prepilin-type N-terminal cleavage/methylation domain-containing protein n=1 Tax=Desulforamulus reducens (strain ATCC BAA-1160 / DSM 100696 / MI-1) TaxID=349161 RepID=A4J8Z8_DESRM|nr:type II secretion system protein [Desulforamulus reducens]ABO51551.1 hypothetical protein Dred_3049 [Desulforamulus reducens MI-1]
MDVRFLFENVISENRNKKVYDKGFTLVEIIAVIAMMTILISIAVTYLFGYVERTKKDVCNTNCLKLERMYEVHLSEGNGIHSEVAFAQYLQDYGVNICPKQGDIRYVDGKVQCSVHPTRRDDDENNDKGGSVPYL